MTAPRSGAYTNERRQRGHLGPLPGPSGPPRASHHLLGNTRVVCARSAFGLPTTSQSFTDQSS